MVVSWKKPVDSYGEILGYVLQLHDGSNVCVKEVITKCTNCIGNLVSEILYNNPVKHPGALHFTKKRH